MRMVWCGDGAREGLLPPMAAQDQEGGDLARVRQGVRPTLRAGRFTRAQAGHSGILVGGKSKKPGQVRLAFQEADRSKLLLFALLPNLRFHRIVLETAEFRLPGGWTRGSLIGIDRQLVTRLRGFLEPEGHPSPPGDGRESGHDRSHRRDLMRWDLMRTAPVVVRCWGRAGLRFRRAHPLRGARACPSDNERFDLLVKVLGRACPEDTLAIRVHPMTPSLSLSLGGKICQGETYSQRAMSLLLRYPPQQHGDSHTQIWLIRNRLQEGLPRRPQRGTPVFYVASNSAVPRRELSKDRSEVFNERAASNGRLLMATLLVVIFPEGRVPSAITWHSSISRSVD